MAARWPPPFFPSIQEAGKQCNKKLNDLNLEPVKGSRTSAKENAPANRGASQPYLKLSFVMLRVILPFCTVHISIPSLAVSVKSTVHWE